MKEGEKMNKFESRIEELSDLAKKQLMLREYFYLGH